MFMNADRNSPVEDPDCHQLQVVVDTGDCEYCYVMQTSTTTASYFYLDNDNDNVRVLG